MTSEEKYIELLKELSELIHGKNERILFQDYQIEHLKAQLDKAEEELKKGKNYE